MFPSEPVVTKSGEEGETLLFENKTKLYKLKRETIEEGGERKETVSWVEIGLARVHVLVHKDDSSEGSEKQEEGKADQGNVDQGNVENKKQKRVVARRITESSKSGSQILVNAFLPTSESRSSLARFLTEGKEEKAVQVALPKQQHVSEEEGEENKKEEEGEEKKEEEEEEATTSQVSLQTYCFRFKTREISSQFLASLS